MVQFIKVEVFKVKQEQGCKIYGPFDPGKFMSISCVKSNSTKDFICHFSSKQTFNVAEIIQLFNKPRIMMITCAIESKI